MILYDVLNAVCCGMRIMHNNTMILNVEVLDFMISGVGVVQDNCLTRSTRVESGDVKNTRIIVRYIHGCAPRASLFFMRSANST